MIKHIFESARPKQWIKNLFVFAAILFSKNVFDPNMLICVLAAFIVFCMLSSAAYMINDLNDIEQDRHHPIKSKRPLASGKLKKTSAYWALSILILLAATISLFFGKLFFITVIGYLALQLAYSLKLKYLVIVDVFTLAFGFVLRVVAGAVIINVEISSWVIICTLLLALFLGFAKRRHEITLLEKRANKHRDVLGQYTPYLLDQMMVIVSSSVVVAYALYTMAEQTIEKSGTTHLILTTPFVMYGIFRYLYLVHSEGEGGTPENTLVSDKPLLINVFLWILTSGLIIYL